MYSLNCVYSMPEPRSRDLAESNIFRLPFFRLVRLAESGVAETPIMPDKRTERGLADVLIGG